jgi:hypothetical protein
MRDWNRSTHECPLESFPADVVSALNEHIEQHNLGKILADALLCIETKSVKIKKGLLGSGETIATYAVLTPRWLIWAIRDGKDRLNVISAQLADIVVTNYSKSKMAHLIQDSGVDITGYFTGATQMSLSEGRGSIFIGLGADISGNKFEETIIHAMQNVKK